MIDILSVGRDYLREDGCYKLEYGKKLEELYEDKDRFLIMHYINASCHFRGKDETIEIKDNIYKEGLHSSIQGMDCINALDRTAHGNFEDDKSFMELMALEHKIIIMLPKRLLAKNAEEPIWNLIFQKQIYSIRDIFYQNMYMDILIQIQKKSRKIQFRYQIEKNISINS